MEFTERQHNEFLDVTSTLDIRTMLLGWPHVNIEYDFKNYVSPFTCSIGPLQTIPGVEFLITFDNEHQLNISKLPGEMNSNEAILFGSAITNLGKLVKTLDILLIQHRQIHDLSPNRSKNTNH